MRWPPRTHTFSVSALPSWGRGHQASPGEGSGPGGGCLRAWEEERKDNPLAGTEPLLFKMDHTQLDKYCKNLQISLFINPYVCRVHPSTTCGGFLFSSACYRREALPAPKDLRGAHLNPAAEPCGQGGAAAAGLDRRPAWDFEQVGQAYSAARGPQQPNSPRCPGPLGSRDKCQLKTHKATLIIPSSPGRPSAFPITATTLSSPCPKRRASPGSVAGPGIQ